MKVIIKKDHEKLGKTGELVNVKDGYARNYLIPQGIAVFATEKNMKQLEEEQRMRERQQLKDKKAAEALAEELGNISITAAVTVGEEDKVFGSVTTQMISDLLAEKGHIIDKRKIQLDEPIKTLGVYTVSIKLHSEVEAKVRVWVVKE